MSPVAALIIAVLVLSVIVAILLYMVIRAVNKIDWLHEDLHLTTDREHAKCVAATMAFVGDEFAAQVLDVAADDYASAQSHGGLDRISRLVYKPGGPPIPSLWLRERADRLRIMADAERTSILGDLT